VVEDACVQVGIIWCVLELHGAASLGCRIRGCIKVDHRDRRVKYDRSGLCIVEVQCLVYDGDIVVICAFDKFSEVDVPCPDRKYCGVDEFFCGIKEPECDVCLVSIICTYVYVYPVLIEAHAASLCPSCVLDCRGCCIDVDDPALCLVDLS